MNKGLKIFLGVLALLLVAGAVVSAILFFRWRDEKADAEAELKHDEALLSLVKDEEKVDMGTGGYTPSEKTTEARTEETTEAATEAATEAQLSGDAAKFAQYMTNESISIYSWNTELGDRLNYFYEKYPEYKDKVNYVNLGLGGTSDDYKIALQNAIDLGGSSYPSIICMDNDVAHYFMESDWCVNLDQVGITSDMTKNCYSYTLQFANVNGGLKALSWQACPGSFMYRNDIANDVFGTSEPDYIQSKISTWEGFLSAADELKAKGYKILSGPDDVKYVFLDQRTTPWVQDDKLQIDQSVIDYLNFSKQLYDGDYTNRTMMWSSEWNDNFDQDVFGYFGCTWFVYWCIPENSKFYGNCSICQGPFAYHWGGSYLSVTKDCPNPGLAALVIYTLCCDTEVMQKLSEETLDFVNNKAAIQNMISEGKGGNDALAGMNPLAVWNDAAEKLSLKNATSYDSTINGYLDTVSAGYNSGAYSSRDEAINELKTSVSATYPFIDVD